MRKVPIYTLGILERPTLPSGQWLDPNAEELSWYSPSPTNEVFFQPTRRQSSNPSSGL